MSLELKAFLNGPVGPKTTHFWGPVTNWGFVLALLFPTADAAQSSMMRTLGDTVVPGIFVALALCIALPKRSKNCFFNCAFLRYTISLIVAIIIMNWFQGTQPAVLYVAPGVIGLVAIHWLWNEEVKHDGTNQQMGKVWNWNMYGTKLKKFYGWVLHDTTNEDGNSGEEDATAPLEDHGYGGEEDAAAPLEDHGDQGDCGAADEIVPSGLRAVQVLAIRANFSIEAINGSDWETTRRLYFRHEMEVQEKGMVDLVLSGPRYVFSAYGMFRLQVFRPIPRGRSTTARGNCDYRRLCPITGEWDVSGDDDNDDDNDEPKEYREFICTSQRGCYLETTFLVIPSSIETKVYVKLKLKDVSSRNRAVYGKIRASCADYGNKSVHLFSCERGRSCSIPSGLTSILPLSPNVIALPYRRQLELHIEVDLVVITIFDDQEECKDLKFSLTFNRGIRNQEREVDGDQVEVSIKFSPEI